MQPKQLVCVSQCIHRNQERKFILEQWRWAAHDIVRCQQHPIPNAIPIIQDAPMTQARSLGHGCRPTGKLDIRDLMRIQSLVFQRTSLPTIFHHMLISAYAPIFRDIYPPRRVVHKHNILQRRHKLRLEFRPSEVRHEMCEERDIRPRLLARKICFSADNEV
jgi:hypothetical protein